MTTRPQDGRAVAWVAAPGLLVLFVAIIKIMIMLGW